MKKTYTIIVIVLVLLMLAGIYVVSHYRATPPIPAPTTSVTYACNDNKTIQAGFTDTDAVLTLSDGRTVTLPHVMSGSGIRYEANGIVLVGKGDNAFLEENGTQTYVDCIANSSADAPTTGDATQFMDSGKTFSFSYPKAFTLSGGDLGYTQSWMENATTSGLVLAKVTLPKSFQPSTNFSEAVFTVGTSPDPTAVATCLTYNPSGGPATSSSSETINGTTYTVLHSSDAGAGNLYETTSYRTIRNSQCYAIEYTIHSTNIGNYSPDQGITAFDRDSVEGALKGIVQSFKFL
ncbi:MAG: MliC family protein [Patescibacteria group bacterium]